MIALSTVAYQGGSKKIRQQSSALALPGTPVDAGRKTPRKG